MEKYSMDYVLFKSQNGDTKHNSKEIIEQLQKGKPCASCGSIVPIEVEFCKINSPLRGEWRTITNLCGKSNDSSIEKKFVTLCVGNRIFLTGGSILKVN